jgi:LPXTG-site transpeptidase (sortase) family protein
MDENNQRHTDDGIPNMPVPQKKSTSDDDKATKDDPNLAADLIRQKLRDIYDDAPKATQELAELKDDDSHVEHSKHQKFILGLQNSNKSLVEIQTQWHNYYMSLPDSEKNQVWQEFYAANKQAGTGTNHIEPNYTAEPDNPPDDDKPRVIPQQFTRKEPEIEGKKTAADIKHELLSKVQKRTSSSWFQRVHSLAFGLAVGFFVILIFLFSFFNDRFIAPFITPSRNVSAQSLIVNPNGGAVGPNPVVIIPKINVEIPVVYTVPTIDENEIENSLEDGVVHYPITALPGQDGNGAIFGHSSNNILNPGKYKFAFVLLHDLQIGDTFTLDYQGKAYVYQIFEKQIVSPSDVSILNDIPGHTATFTLITCDPPGTSINRLFVVGDQISPSVASNTAGPDQNNAVKPTVLPSNSQSLWSRLFSWL